MILQIKKIFSTHKNVARIREGERKRLESKDPKFQSKNKRGKHILIYSKYDSEFFNEF
jgi:hypothetical protein